MAVNVTWSRVLAGPGGGVSWFNGVARTTTDTLIAVSNNGQVWRSTNNGLSWSQVTTIPGFGGASAYGPQGFSPANHIAFFGSLESGFTGSGAVWRTLDDGNTWTKVYSRATNNGQQDLQYQFVDLGGGVYLLGGMFMEGEAPAWKDILRSVDAGATWTRYVQVDASGDPVTALARLSNGRLLAGKNFHANLWKSINDGVSWSALPNLPNFAGHNVLNILDMGSGVIIVTGAASGGGGLRVWRSTDYGETFSQITNILGWPDAANLFAAEGSVKLAANTLVYAFSYTTGTQPKPPWRASTDNGVSFQIQTEFANPSDPTNIEIGANQLVLASDGSIIAVYGSPQQDNSPTIWRGVVTGLPIIEHRHYTDQIMLSLFQREASYDAGPTAWTAAQACSMQDFDNDSPHEEWDDLITDDAEFVTGDEYPNVMVIARQSVRLRYAEPRTKPNSLAGLLGLALGTVATTKEVGFNAWRHKLTPALPYALSSIGAQVAHQHSSQYQYKGIKADGFSLRNNGAYLMLEVPLIGSGTRATAGDDFTAAITEGWLRWGDCRIFLLDTGGTPITVPTTPVQGATNLGAGAVEFSKKVLRCEIGYPAALQAEQGYRASTGKVRGLLHAGRRRTDLTLEFQIDTATESTELDWYLSQKRLAFELNCDSGQAIVAGGTFRYGFTIVIPRLQIRRIPRGENVEFDTLRVEGRVLSDQTNPVIIAWVWNGVSAYLQ